MKMGYKWSDLKQSSIGSFVAVIFIFAIRGDNPFFFDPMAGFFITVALLVIYYNGFKMKNKNLHFALDAVVSFAVSAFSAQMFGLIEPEQILTFDVFGSLVIVGLWVGFSKGLLFDRYNIVNPMSGSYLRGK